MARPPALSPSRASDFRQCPLMFRLRTIDKVGVLAYARQHGVRLA